MDFWNGSGRGVAGGDDAQPPTRGGHRLWAALLGAVTTLALVVGLIASLTPDAAPAVDVPHADTSIAGTPVTVGVDVCGAGWTGGDAGPQTFALWNNSIQGLEVYLEDDSDEHIVLDAENLGAGATRTASVVLAPGWYEFVCLPTDEEPEHGPPQQVTGNPPTGTTPGIVPVTRNDLLPAVSTYERWIRSQLPALQHQMTQLDADIRRGDLTAARHDWLTAHLRYETLGAAYGAFGDHDTAINGMPASGRPALDDPHLTGFHRIEALLWSGAPAGRIAPYTHRLVGAVAALRADFVGQQLVDTLDMGLRSHEILENAIQFELTGASDAGSHTNLATIDANLTGTTQAMRPLRGLLRQRDPDLAATERWIARSQRLVCSFDHHGRWLPLEELSRTQREGLDAALTQTVELLSEVAVITDPRRAIS
ncbi:EfeM/EfeO family lipoprotein [Nocardioides sp.]|uniref:EfeM/EfeO family lipoprotein n=1 Tax=Nocardioides sp. TaxID=35761 RepID=UPI0031FEF26C|nr:EfeM/EfeO family lipoprotein [Nocardioides sp.]